MKISPAAWGTGVLWLALSVSKTVLGYDLDPKDPESIKSISWKIAHELMSFYGGNRTINGVKGVPGIFGDPYHWWESGAAFGALVDYWYFTGDAGNNNATQQAIVAQVGDKWNFEPVEQNHGLGNDDQCFWALTVMSAAEKKFPDPPKGKPQYLALAQAVFNRMAERINKEEREGICGGGLRWQIMSWKDGYWYKNSVTNGCFFQLGARLARYTNNGTYADEGEEAYNWMEKTGLIDDTYHVRDGVDAKKNCAPESMDGNQWTYNVGMVMAGAAYMYNYSAEIKDHANTVLWHQRVDGFIEAAERTFFNHPEAPGIMNEYLCEYQTEKRLECNIDQRSFKAYLARFMALTVQMAPWTYDKIMPMLEKSAVGAAKQCSNGEKGKTCGMWWTRNGEWDRRYGVGEQMAALEVIHSLLLDKVEPAVTAETGGTSGGDPNAGGANPFRHRKKPRIITAADRAGASVLTCVTVILLLGMSYWLLKED